MWTISIVYRSIFVLNSICHEISFNHLCNFIIDQHTLVILLNHNLVGPIWNKCCLSDVRKWWYLTPDRHNCLTWLTSSVVLYSIFYWYIRILLIILKGNLGYFFSYQNIFTRNVLKRYKLTPNTVKPVVTVTCS